MKAKLEKEKLAQSHAQLRAKQQLDTTTETTNKTDKSTTMRGAGAHVSLQFYQADIMKDVILLDNQSSASS
jgi:hypothetical protein